MLIDTSALAALPGIAAATLSQSGDAPSTLHLSWRGFGPDWLRYLEPVTLMHKGRVLFHGRITSFSRSNDAGSLESSCTASDALWLLDHLPLGAQAAEAVAANAASAADFGAAGQAALLSWAALAESCRISAPLWAADADGEPREDATIWLDASLANYSSGAAFKRDAPITAWTALLEMRQANPDALFRFNPVSGAVEAISIARAPAVEWDTDRMRLLSCSDIGPQYENCIAGVALAVSWQGADGAPGGSMLQVFPPSVAPGDMGVRLFTASADNAQQAAAQADYMMRQLEAYYNAANALQHGGSVSAMMEDVEDSPLCRRMNISGTGTHPSWHGMLAMVTAAEWDFLDGTVEAQLGATINEPDITEMAFADRDGEFSSDDGMGGDFSSDEEESACEFDSLTTWDYTTTWGGSDTWEDSSTWDFTSTAAASASGSGSGPAHGSGSASSTGSASGPPETTATSPGGCDCAPKWAAYEERMAALEARVAYLESLHAGSGQGSATDGTCGCACEGLLEAIRAAVQEAANGVTLNASVRQAVMTTDSGEVAAQAHVQTAGGGGSASITFAY